MAKLKTAGVNIYSPDKKLFAEKSKSVLQNFRKDPAMVDLVDAILKK